MKITFLNQDEYIKVLDKGFRIYNPFQLPQYHYIREKIHKGEYFFKALRIDSGMKSLLVPVLSREREKGYPEITVYFNSISSSDKKIPDEDYKMIFDVLKKQNPFTIKIAASLENPNPFSAIKSKIRLSLKKTYVLNLPEDYDTWFSSISSNTRRKIRKAEKIGVKIAKRGKEGLNNFITFFHKQFFENPTMLNEWPEAFFYKLFKLMPDGAVFFYEAELDGKVEAMSLFLLHEGHCFYHSSTHLKSDGNSYANNLLQAALIKDLISSGIKIYNMGGTGGIDELATFKEQFGAKPMEYFTLHWKNRLKNILKSFRFPRLKKLRFDKHFLMKKELNIKESPLEEFPPFFECKCIKNDEELKEILSGGYNISGRDIRGKKFMNEKIARFRLEQKQYLYFIFREKMLLSSRCWVRKESLPYVDLIPPMNLEEDEFFTWHGNTTGFYRNMGYYTRFYNIASDYLVKKHGIKRVYSAVKEKNTPAIHMQERAGSEKIASFYLLSWKKKYWCFSFKDL
jgi:GNAT acetyltransferase-like protein